MSNTIQIGGIGKNPAIDKINSLNALTSRIDIAARLEQAVFQTNQDNPPKQVQRRNQIIQDFSISFKSGK
ncbi:hypothetical protein ADH76_31660 [Enterocloster clostridioformis]|uniref:hypothetical protein n=1 Tax=Enterocloster clostridioformis TaxID=1531 RepID=UPI00080CB1CE|nr:hypothetical protein [Enterocloster clostridioformis]ANU46804.1 hypothetical protein A4V08_14280 [Lachnoclostridium sp. YL32]NDO26875.1 hypothetical protein [Enterocloster clostridioformis]OXE62395.1 hypothetical protein ADH76_31660 [Enterocloster clostridioformis]QQQ98490.1 hypothetical protein I5Q83_20315 [Enterocloster clostridioformis]